MLDIREAIGARQDQLPVLDYGHLHPGYVAFPHFFLHEGIYLAALERG